MSGSLPIVATFAVAFKCLDNKTLFFYCHMVFYRSIKFWFGDEKNSGILWKICSACDLYYLSLNNIESVSVYVSFSNKVHFSGPKVLASLELNDCDFNNIFIGVLAYPFILRIYFKLFNLSIKKSAEKIFLLYYIKF